MQFAMRLSCNNLPKLKITIKETKMTMQFLKTYFVVYR